VLFSDPLCVANAHSEKSIEDALRSKVRPSDLQELGPKYFGSDRVEVQLEPGRDDIGIRIKNCYGDRVEVTLGFTKIPPDRSKRCPDLPSTRLPSGVTAKVDLSGVDPRTISHPRQGQWPMGRLVIGYHGPGAFYSDTGNPLAAELVRPRTLHVVAGYAGIWAGVGYEVVVSDSQTNSLGLVFPNYRCDGEPGSAIPPGNYGVRVQFGDAQPMPGIFHAGIIPGGVYVSDEALITVR
jgi:hypothetical protein